MSEPEVRAARATQQRCVEEAEHHRLTADAQALYIADLLVPRRVRLIIRYKRVTVV